VPWDSSGDSLQAFSWGAADSSYNGQSLDQSLPTPLADGGTTAIENGVDSSALFSNADLLQASRGDILYILQTATDSSGVGPYQAVRAGLALDGLNQPGLVGTLAGDDTVFVASDSAAAQKRLIEFLNSRMAQTS